MFTLKEKELEGKRTILIVDDEEINGDILSSFLDDEFEIRRAFNGKECLDIIAKEHDVINKCAMAYFNRTSKKMG